jgi:hypothetical protein
MATHELTTNGADLAAAEREARYISIIAEAVWDVLPETRDRALRVLDRARERVLAGPAVREVPVPDSFLAG